MPSQALELTLLDSGDVTRRNWTDKTFDNHCASTPCATVYNSGKRRVTIE